MAKSKQVSPEQAAANAKAIEDAWRKGRQSQRRLQQLKKDDPTAYRRGYPAALQREEADRMGVSTADLAGKFRRVGMQYSVDDIADIGEQVRKHNSRFAPLHLVDLLPVADRKQRDKLMRQAIRESWSQKEVQRAAQAANRHRRQPGAGRKPHVPDDPRERLIALASHSDRFQRFADAVREGLPEQVRALALAATVTLKAMQEEIAKELEREEGE